MRRHGDHPRPTIGVFSYGFSGNFLWAGATAAARQHDVNLIGFAGGSLHSPRGFEAQANVLFDLIDPQQIDGLLLDSGILSHYVGTNALREFCGRYSGIPIVSSEVALEGIPSVLLDFYQGIRDLIGHLITAHGCRRIAFIRGFADRFDRTVIEGDFALITLFQQMTNAMFNSGIGGDGFQTAEVTAVAALA